jgi:hypothetical protein
MNIFLGITRFSVLSPGSSEWQISSIDRSKYENVLFSDERLSIRSKIFFDISLPILATASNNFGYIHVVQYSSNLPERYREKLFEAASQYSFLRVLEVDSIDVHSKIYEGILLDFVKGRGEIDRFLFGVFNLDDDDLLSINYFRNSEKYLESNNVGRYLSFGEGFVCVNYSDKRGFSNFRKSYLPKINIGLMKLCEYNKVDGFVFPPSADHMQVDRFAPLILDSREPAYLWIKSVFQDTNTKNLGLDAPLGGVLEALDLLPPLEDVVGLDKYFPGLVAHLPAIEMEEIIIGSDLILSSSGIAVDFPFEARGDFVIKYEIDLADGLSHNLALISLRNVSLGDGVPVDSLLGFTLSDDPEIGFYRYLVTDSGAGLFTVSFSLPLSCRLYGFRLRSWFTEERIMIKCVSFSKLG